MQFSSGRLSIAWLVFFLTFKICMYMYVGRYVSMCVNVKQNFCGYHVAADLLNFGKNLSLS